LAIDRVGVTGVLKTLAASDRLLTDLDLDSKESIRIELSFEPSELQFLGLWRRGGEVGVLDLAQGRISATHSGPNHYTFSFAQKGVPRSPIRANIYAGRTLLSASTMRVNESPSLR
jgi:hypothetical protein